MNRNAEYHHVPVLLEEVLRCLQIHEGERVIDGTLGGGGYSKALLGLVGDSGRVLSVDLDDAALENFRLLIADSSHKKQSILVKGNFQNIDQIAERHEFTLVHKIVVDIGLSSFQIDQSGRGISFQNEEPLDMRFDVSSTEPDARYILNHATFEELAKIFNTYGEERYAGQIAKAVLRRREQKQLELTTDLVACIEEALPKPVKHRYKDSCRRIFQALRIAVNHELENLETFLPKAFDILAPGGRLAVVTFHSLEDRIVKQFFAGLAKGCVCPIDFPACVCGKLPLGDIITRKPITASEQELITNPRSHSAKLRVIEKRSHLSI